MGAIAPLTILDGQATPVSHTFDVSRKDAGLAIWQDRSSGTFLGYPKITMTNRLPSTKNGNYKASVKIVVPVLETVTAASNGLTPGPTKAYDLTANVDFIIPSRAEAGERDDILAYLRDLLSQSVITELVADGSLPY
jgi:hypothetical protein